MKIEIPNTKKTHSENLIHKIASQYGAIKSLINGGKKNANMQVMIAIEARWSIGRNLMRMGVPQEIDTKEKTLNNDGHCWWSCAWQVE